MIIAAILGLLIVIGICTDKRPDWTTTITFKWPEDDSDENQKDSKVDTDDKSSHDSLK